MNTISQAFIAQAESLPNYSKEELLNDLLSVCFEPITYDEAAEIAKVQYRTIVQWVFLKRLKRYGVGRKFARINKFELMRMLSGSSVSHNNKTIN